MYLSKFFLATLKDAPSDAQIPSYSLMVRAGLMRKLASGLYAYLPLGMRVLNKTANIVRREMEQINFLECQMPLLLPKEMLTISGRWDIFKKELFRLEDRHNAPHALGATHEEAFTFIASELQSYKQLPLSLYQIHTKFRDEIRPRFGVIRSREFLMKDGYSFHLSEECLSKTYSQVSAAYSRSFAKMGVNTVSVKADSGAMGGDGSEEFMFLSNVGEEDIIFCSGCHYRANAEKATSELDPKPTAYTNESPVEIDTPNIITIHQLEEFFNGSITACSIIKTIIYTLETGESIAVLIRGDLDINETKLTNHLDGLEFAFASEASVEDITGSPVGFAGPIGLKKKIRIVADHSLKSIASAVIGANKKDTHIINVNIERDLQIDSWVDLRQVKANDPCPLCGAKLQSKRGLELGHIFKLGQKYSKAFNLTVLNELGKPTLLTMGCYGIGINRSIAAIIEQHHDERGIIFPISVAPYEVIIVALDKPASNSFDIAKKLYESLINEGVETLFDDRVERAGVKLSDADLIGIPMRIVVGERGIKSNVVEFKLRNQDSAVEIECEQIVSHVLDTKSRLFNNLEN